MADGLQFPLDATGRRSSVATGRRILASALQVLDAAAAQAVLDERDWRQRYPTHLKRLVELQAARPSAVAASCRAGLDSAWGLLPFERQGATLALAEAMAAPQTPFGSTTLTGAGPAAPARWEVPYRGQRLHGDALARRIDAWERAGVCEPTHALALRELQQHPEWFDLSDRTIALLGAGSEAGPLSWLAQWRANLVAIDLPKAAVWKRVARQVHAGNATLIAPLATGATAIEQAGADLIAATPEIAQWLLGLGRPIDLGCIAYADGERHVRVSLAMDAIAAALAAAEPRTTLAWMATPTDVFAVSESLARVVMAGYEDRGLLRRVVQAGLRAGSGGRSFAPHIDALVDADDDSRWGVIDALVVEQGPNYALAKRLQQWRAIVARGSGTQASLHVAPSTTTASVLSNPLLAAGFRGAKAFDVEVFEPATTNAIMAALWVRDLRRPQTIRPEMPTGHPLAFLAEGALHGGLWRMPYLPRTVLPFAALLGFMKRR